MAKRKVRVQLLNEQTNEVIEEVDVMTSADSVVFGDGETFQDKLNSGKLKGEKGDKGDKGDAFSIAKVYSSISAMNADYSNNEVTLGQFVVIDTGNVNDVDNAKLYVKGLSSYTYLTDLSGADGLQGPQGTPGINGKDGNDGQKGNTGTSIRFKGEWNSSTLYVSDANYIDLVVNNGNTYRCKLNNTNQAVTNTTYWELVAKKGADGATGTPGAKGDPGTPGKDGLDGDGVKIGTTLATATEGKLFFKVIN